MRCAQVLAKALPGMKNLKSLNLNKSEIGDSGVIQIIKAIKDSSNLEKLNLSGNEIGKSAAASECFE